MAQFKTAIEYVLANEGGYSVHPGDLGGETNYGISKRRYPGLDIAELTLQDAIDIYERDYWNLFQVGMLKGQNLATKVLDAVVWMGPRPAIRALQRALRAVGRGVTEDGLMGPETARAANAMDERILLPALRSELAGRLRKIMALNPDQKVFEKGWLRRAYL